MASESRMKTWPHSVHSLRAVSSLLMVAVSRSVRAVAEGGGGGVRGGSVCVCVCVKEREREHGAKINGLFNEVYHQVHIGLAKKVHTADKVQYTHKHTCWRYFTNLSQSGHGVGDDHGGGVREQVLEEIKEALVLDQLSIDVVKLGHTHSSCLAHVGVVILRIGKDELQVYHIYSRCTIDM